MKIQTLYSPRTPKWPPSEKGELISPLPWLRTFGATEILALPCLKLGYLKVKSIFQSPTCLTFCLLTDIDECANNHGGCNHECINTAGSFHCQCFPGFEFETSQKKNCRGKIKRN